MGYGANSDGTVAQLTELAGSGEIDAVFHNGDISYADGDQHHWDVYFRKIEPIASTVPYLTTPGNHEFWFNFSAYKHRVAMPMAEKFDSMFYSIDIGSVHILAMNTETVIDKAGMSKEQVAWIRLNLATARASPRTRFKVAFGHRPLYTSAHGGNDVPAGNAVLQGLVEDILITEEVDLVVQAHIHDYGAQQTALSLSPSLSLSLSLFLLVLPASTRVRQSVRLIALGGLLVALQSARFR